MGEVNYKELSLCFKKFILEYILIVIACRLLSPAPGADGYTVMLLSMHRQCFPGQFSQDDH